MDFADKMKTHTKEKLIEIVTKLRDDYNPDAVIAAEEELKKRNIKVSEIVADHIASKTEKETQKYSGSGKPLKANVQRSKIAIILLWIVVVLEIVSLGSNYLEWNLFQKAASSYYMPYDEMSANSTRQIIIGIISTITFIISAVTFILWFRRAYYNLHLIVNGLTFTDGWAVGSWFVPIINLYRPFQIMKELYQETKELLIRNKIPTVKSFTTSSLGTWWGLWIISNIVVYGISRYSWRAETIDELGGWTLISMVVNVISILGAIITIKVIKDYSNVEPLLNEIKDGGEKLRTINHQYK